MRGAAGIALATLPFAVLGVYAARFFGPDKLERDDALTIGVTSGLAAFLFQAQITGRFDAIEGGNSWLVASVLALVAVAATAWIWIVLRRRQHEQSSEGSPWLFAGVVVAVLAAIVPFAVEAARYPSSLSAPTPWYYWSLALQTAEAGGLPAASIEWGQEVAFLADYPAFTSATAATIDLIGNAQLQAAHLMRVLAAAATALGFFSLARSWGSSRIAAIAGVFAFLATDVYLIKLASYRPEAFGYGLMLLAPALLKRYMDTGNRTFAVTGGVSLLALSQVHGLTFTLCGILLIATVLVASAARPDLRTLKEASIGVVTFAGIWILGSLALRGQLTDAAKLDTAPEVGVDGVDPTWVFASFGSRREGLDPPGMSELVLDSLGRGFAGVPTGWFIAAAAIVVATVGYLALKRSAEAQEFLAFALLVIVGTLVFSAIWFIGWETYVPRRTGAGRVVQLLVVLVPLGGAVAASLIRQVRIRDIAMTVLATLSIVVWIAGIARLSDLSESQRPSDSTIELQQALDLEPGIALSNAYTEGYLPAVFGVHGLLDGRAPYTESDLLDRANQLREDARQFFEAPAQDGFDFAGYEVDYVIVANRRWILGTPRIFDVDQSALNDMPNLELVARDRGYRVYRVVGTESSTTAATR